MCRPGTEDGEGKKTGEVLYLESLRRRADDLCCHLARGKPALDLCLGETFLRLVEKNYLIDLTYSCQVDFANEELGLPPRTFFFLKDLAKGLRSRPLLRQAVLCGEVTAVKAIAVMERATGEDETLWTALAMEHTLKELQRLVAESGGETPRAFGFELLRLAMTPLQQDRLDAALSLAREMVGHGALRWKQTDAVVRDYLASRGEEEPTEETEEIASFIEEVEKKNDSIGKQMDVLFEALQLLEEPMPVEDNALGLLALARKLLARREHFAEPLGRLLCQVDGNRVWHFLGYDSFADYCRERLGISESTARQRMRLESKLRGLPPLREALKSGKITYTKAIQIARHATLYDVRKRVEEAASTTLQQTRRKADDEEDKKDRQKGERKLRGPAEALQRFSRAVTLMREEVAETLDAGEALARMGDRYFDKWEIPVRNSHWRTKREQDAFMRHGGLCAVPGCTREAQHLHHIIYRRDGGPDAPWNLLAVCWAHHKKNIHRDKITVRGDAGQHLVWVIGSNELRPRKRYETHGLDDVRAVAL